MSVHLINRQKQVVVSRSGLRRLLEAVMVEELGRPTEVNVLVTDDQEIAELNERFLGHRGPTDVLSFGLEEEEGDEERSLGDVAVSAETAAREGPKHGNSAEEELALYAVHGLLHLLGYDDQEASARQKMWKRQEEIMKGFHAGTGDDRNKEFRT